MSKQLTISITTGTIIKTILVIGMMSAAWFLRDILLIMLTSIVLASAIEPVAKSLSKYKIPRVISVLSVYVSFFSFFIIIGLFFIPPVLSESAGLLSELPQYAETVDTGSAPLLSFFGEDASVQELTKNLNGLIDGFKSNFIGTMSSVFGGLFAFILIIVFSFYFAVQEGGIQEFLYMVTPKNNEKYVVDLWKRSQAKIGLWMQGQVLLAVIIGVLVYLGLAILGVKYALVLAVIAAVFELIPVFGPILAAVPAMAMAFATGGASLMLGVMIFYVIIQQFENNLIYPLVVTKVVGVPPVIVILALLVGAKLGGFLGILLSVPLAAVLQELVMDFDKTKRVARKATKA